MDKRDGVGMAMISSFRLSSRWMPNLVDHYTNLPSRTLRLDFQARISEANKLELSIHYASLWSATLPDPE
jgi:hypothetical protein